MNGSTPTKFQPNDVDGIGMYPGGKSQIPIQTIITKYMSILY